MGISGSQIPLFLLVEFEENCNFLSQRNHLDRSVESFHVGILVDKDDLINYQLVLRYRLLKRIVTNQPTVDKTIVLSTIC